MEFSSKRVLCTGACYARRAHCKIALPKRWSRFACAVGAEVGGGTPLFSLIV